MAFAPHANNANNAYAAGEPVPLLLGQFQEKEAGHWFEFAARPAGVAFAPEFPHIVYVGPEGGYRFAKVLKSVAYVVVEEGPGGEPVVEKWAVKKFSAYEIAWAEAARAACKK